MVKTRSHAAAVSLESCCVFVYVVSLLFFLLRNSLREDFCATLNALKLNHYFENLIFLTCQNYFLISYWKTSSTKDQKFIQHFKARDNKNLLDLTHSGIKTTTIINTRKEKIWSSLTFALHHTKPVSLFETLCKYL